MISHAHRRIGRNLRLVAKTIPSAPPTEVKPSSSHRRLLVNAVTRRHFSDRLLGHSPMAAPLPGSSSSSAEIPTEKDVAVAGGVWAPTSAKRDALAELKTDALQSHNKESLDEMATPLQELDLFLADGMLLLAKVGDLSAAGHGGFVAEQLQTWWTELRCWKTEKESLSQVEWEEQLRDFIRETDSYISTLPADRYLQGIREYMPLPSEMNGDASWQSSAEAKKVVETTQINFDHAVLRYRLTLVKTAAEKLLDSWSKLTSNTDQEVDRAAVQAAKLETSTAVDNNSKVMSTESLRDVLHSFWFGGCSERIDAIWALLSDEEALMDQDRIGQACDLLIEPTGEALSKLLQESLEASPARVLLPEIDSGLSQKESLSWRQRRQDSRVKKQLSRMFSNTVKYHFRDEVEIPHRLRCIYAWANKDHQGNKIESVTVESGGGLGRKRYVELHPMIRLPEFREVQKVHFTHLDRVGQEFVKSFREDLLVRQGKGRQRRELFRDSALFLALVSMVDYVILSL